MKTIFLLTGLLLSSLCSKSQLFTLPIYLHDAIGNPDTVYISGDQTASTLLDINFGEVNLNGVPYDSIFEARLTHDAFSATRIETKTQALYYECSPLGGYLQGNTLIVRCKNWPLTIKWNRYIIDSVGLCINWSGISKDLAYLGGDFPQYYLESRDSVVYPSSQLFSPYSIGINNGLSAPVYVIAIGISDDGTVDVEEVSKQAVSIWPNPASDKLNIQGIQATDYTLSIFDLSGKLMLDKLQTEDNTLDVSLLASGFYLATLRSKSFTSTLKWFKL